MIGDEADGREHDVVDAARGDAPQVIEHVGLEPRHVRRAAAALVDELPVGDADGLRHEPRRLAQLILVAARPRHRERDRVRRERQMGPRRSLELLQRLPDVIGVRLDPTGWLKNTRVRQHLRRPAARSPAAP